MTLDSHLARLTIGHFQSDGTHIIRTFAGDGQGKLVEQSPILQPVEPDGTDALDNRPGGPTPTDHDNVIVWNPSAAAWFAQHPQHMTPIQEVDFMNISAAALKLVAQYLERIADEEHPHAGIQKGYTPRELGIRRKVAHDKLMAQLRADGIQFTDRTDVTEFARRCDK